MVGGFILLLDFLLNISFGRWLTRCCYNDDESVGSTHNPKSPQSQATRPLQQELLVSWSYFLSLLCIKRRSVHVLSERMTTEAPELSSAPSPSPFPSPSPSSCPACTEVDLGGDQWFVLMEPSRVGNQLVLLKRSKRTTGSPLCGRSDVLLRSFTTSASVHWASAVCPHNLVLGKGAESEESGWTQSSYSEASRVTGC